MNEFLQAAIDEIMQPQLDRIEADQIEMSDNDFVRLEYESRRQAIVNLFRTRKGLGEAIIQALWDEYLAGTYRIIGEMDSLREWADSYIAPEVYNADDDKSFLYDMVFIVENTLHLIHQRQAQGKPIILQAGEFAGKKLTVQFVLQNIEKMGLISKLKMITPEIKANMLAAEAERKSAKTKTEPLPKLTNPPAGGVSLEIEDDEEEPTPSADQVNEELVAAVFEEPNREELKKRKAAITGKRGDVLRLPRPTRMEYSDGNSCVVFDHMTPNQEKLLMSLVRNLLELEKKS